MLDVCFSGTVKLDCLLIFYQLGITGSICMPQQLLVLLVPWLCNVVLCLKTSWSEREWDDLIDLITPLQFCDLKHLFVTEMICCSLEVLM